MASFVYSLAATPLCAGAALAADRAANSDAVPQFAFMDRGWQAAGVVFLPPESGPGPFLDIPGRPRLAKHLARGQPTYFNQTAKEVLMIWALNAEFRHVYLTDKH